MSCPSGSQGNLPQEQGPLPHLLASAPALTGPVPGAVGRGGQCGAGHGGKGAYRGGAGRENVITRSSLLKVRHRLAGNRVHGGGGHPGPGPVLRPGGGPGVSHIRRRKKPWPQGQEDTDRYDTDPLPTPSGEVTGVGPQWVQQEDPVDRGAESPRKPQAGPAPLWGLRSTSLPTTAFQLRMSPHCLCLFC